MSIKIYNAFRMKADSLDEVIKTFFKEKDTVTEDLEMCIVKDILIEAISLYDKFTLEGEGLPFNKNENHKNVLDYDKNVQSMLFEKLWSKKEDSYKNDNPEIESQVIIYPQPIEHFGEKCYLMQVFGDDNLTKKLQNDYFSKWNIQEYNYWDNSDQPDTVTDYEWELRRKNWKGIEIPLLSGISLTFVKSPKYQIYYMKNTKSNCHIIEDNLQKVQESMTLEKRIEKYITKIKEDTAYKYYYDLAIKEDNLEDATNEQIKEFIMSEGMRIYFKSRDKVKDNDFTDEENMVFLHQEAQIRKILKENITYEDLSKKGQQIVQEAQLKYTKKIKP